MPFFLSCIVKIHYIGRSCYTKKQLLRHSLIFLHCLDYLLWTQGMHAVVSGAQRAWFWTPSGSCFSTIRRRARLWMSALRKVRGNAYIDIWFRKAQERHFVFQITQPSQDALPTTRLKTVAILAQVWLFCFLLFHIIFVRSALHTGSSWF